MSCKPKSQFIGYGLFLPREKNIFSDRKIKNNFRYILKTIRYVNNYTQQDLATILEINSNKLSKYERGYLEPNLSFLIKLMNTFDVRLDDFLDPNLKKTYEHRPRVKKSKEFKESNTVNIIYRRYE